MHGTQTTERLIFIDFETFYSDTYSLKKMTAPEYILGDEYETIICGVQEAKGQPYLVDGPEFPAWLREVDAASACVVSHNAMFDACILAWRYGFVPGRIGCTQLLARATLGAQFPNVKLTTVAKELGLLKKDEQALTNVKGCRRAGIKADAALWDRYVAYCLGDVANCAGIYYKLKDILPDSEWAIMDMVVRCSIEPKLVVDVPRLEANLERVRQEKDGLLAAAGVTVADLMSAAKFKATLESLGVTVDNKVSPTGRTIPALARTDDFMAGLAEHDDPRVQTLAAARLGHKSTIEETRCSKLISIGKLPWPSGMSMMPVPLIYGGTHTHRLSGGWGLNMQNLPKGGELRNSLCAPPGHKLIVADLSQIEARLAAVVAGELALVRAFARGEDVYATFASSVYGYLIDPKVHKAERFIGKTGVLGLQYGCGPTKFHDMVIKQSRSFGVDISKLDWDLDAAAKVVQTYRDNFTRIPSAWRRLTGLIQTTLIGGHHTKKFGPVTIMPNMVKLPGLLLMYPKLAQDDKHQYWYSYGREKRKLYGGSLFENIIQALARIVVMDAAVRLHHQGVTFVMQVHDELVFVVPPGGEWTSIIRTEMTRVPTWAPDLPLAVEISPPVDRYGEAK